MQNHPDLTQAEKLTPQEAEKFFEDKDIVKLVFFAYMQKNPLPLPETVNRASFIDGYASQAFSKIWKDYVDDKSDDNPPKQLKENFLRAARSDDFGEFFKCYFTCLDAQIDEKDFNELKNNNSALTNSYKSNLEKLKTLEDKDKIIKILTNQQMLDNHILSKEILKKFENKIKVNQENQKHQQRDISDIQAENNPEVEQLLGRQEVKRVNMENDISLEIPKRFLTENNTQPLFKENKTPIFYLDGGLKNSNFENTLELVGLLTKEEANNPSISPFRIIKIDETKLAEIANKYCVFNTHTLPRTEDGKIKFKNDQSLKDLLPEILNKLNIELDDLVSCPAFFIDNYPNALVFHNGSPKSYNAKLERSVAIPFFAEIVKNVTENKVNKPLIVSHHFENLKESNSLPSDTIELQLNYNDESKSFYYRDQEMSAKVSGKIHEVCNKLKDEIVTVDLKNNIQTNELELVTNKLKKFHESLNKELEHASFYKLRKENKSKAIENLLNLNFNIKKVGDKYLLSYNDSNGKTITKKVKNPDLETIVSHIVDKCLYNGDSKLEKSVLAGKNSRTKNLINEFKSALQEDILHQLQKTDENTHDQAVKFKEKYQDLKDSKENQEQQRIFNLTFK